MPGMLKNCHGIEFEAKIMMLSLNMNKIVYNILIFPSNEHKNFTFNKKGQLLILISYY